MRRVFISCRCSPDRRSGVTLIELLVAASIVVVVLGAVAAAVSAGVAVWDTARNFDAHRIDALIWIETLEMELRSSLRFHEIAVRCDESSIIFPVIARDESPKEAVSLWEIKYAFDEATGRIRREVRGFPFVAGGGNVDDMIVVSGVTALRLRGVFSEDEEDAEDDGGDKQLTSLRLTVVLGEGRERVEIERTIYLPVEKERDTEDA